jgi:hypothetical protein
MWSADQTNAVRAGEVEVGEGGVGEVGVGGTYGNDVAPAPAERDTTPPRPPAGPEPLPPPRAEVPSAAVTHAVASPTASTGRGGLGQSDAMALSSWADDEVRVTPQPFQPVERPDRRRAPLLIGGTFGALVLIALIVVGVMTLTGGHGHNHQAGPKPTPTPSPTRTHSINNASTDPGPLVLAQFFPASIQQAGRGYTLLGSETTTNCAEVEPSVYQSVITQQDCGEVLRATYESTNKSTIATVAVAVFDSADNSQSVSDTLHQQGSVNKADWLLPMPVKQDSKFTAKSPVICTVMPVGRYLLMWAGGYVDNRRLTSEPAALAQMLGDLFNQAETPIRARMSPSDRAALPDAEQSSAPPVPSATGTPALDRTATSGG